MSDDGKASMVVVDGVTYLDQTSAAAVDADLMGEMGGFHTLQLMELAGLAVATAVEAEYPITGPDAVPSILVVSGGGNNGGDGLIAARHLAQMGYSPEVWNPVTAPRSEDLFTRLITQCDGLDIPVSRSLEDGPPAGKSIDDYDVVLDAVFGFSFRGAPRPPLDAVLASLAAAKGAVVSVDIPSGWDVNHGDVHGLGLMPDVLISLTLPKLCALTFTGTHIIGARFVPKPVADKYGLALPAFAGSSQISHL